MRRDASRRAALAGGIAAWAVHARAQGAGAPPDLVATAAKEGTAVWQTSIDLPVAQKMVGLFNVRHRQARFQLERSGAERVLQRITQEYASGIKVADVVESSDAAMFADFKQRGWLARHVPPDVARHWPATERDPDGTYAGVRATLSVIAYNTKQVKPEDAPKGFSDLLNPRWRSRMVKGERSIMMDGSEYVVFYLKETGNPIEVVYPTEGSPLISGQMVVLDAAPHPAAARLFIDFAFSAECQQLMSNVGGTRSFHPAVSLPAGRPKHADLKVLPTDPDALVKAAGEIKRRYTEYFGV